MASSAFGSNANAARKQMLRENPRRGRNPHQTQSHKLGHCRSENARNAANRYNRKQAGLGGLSVVAGGHNVNTNLVRTSRRIRQMARLKKPAVLTPNKGCKIWKCADCVVLTLNCRRATSFLHLSTAGRRKLRQLDTYVLDGR